jgi:hypothetical protein
MVRPVTSTSADLGILSRDLSIAPLTVYGLSAARLVSLGGKHEGQYPLSYSTSKQHNGFFNRNWLGAAPAASAHIRSTGTGSPLLLRASILTISQTESLFHTYSQFASVPNIPAAPSDDERQTESKLQDILEKVWPILRTNQDVLTCVTSEKI